MQPPPSTVSYYLKYRSVLESRPERDEIKCNVALDGKTRRCCCYQASWKTGPEPNPIRFILPVHQRRVQTCSHSQFKKFNQKKGRITLTRRWKETLHFHPKRNKSVKGNEKQKREMSRKKNGKHFESWANERWTLGCMNNFKLENIRKIIENWKIPNFECF